MSLILGLDIGGTHAAGALVNGQTRALVEDSYHKLRVDTNVDSRTILHDWGEVIKRVLKDKDPGELKGIGVAMPGPFDYEKGISLIKGLDKYEALYGMNVKEALKKELGLDAAFPVYFENDAICFALGEYWAGAMGGYRRAVAITLGTGFGAAFLENGRPLKVGKGVPEGGTLYQLPYRKGKAEDYISARGLLKQYTGLTGETLSEAKVIYERAAQGEQAACQVWADFGETLADFLMPWLRSFKADCLVIGGNIAGASGFFLEKMKENLLENDCSINVMISKLGEKAAILGAASLLKDKDTGGREIGTLRKSNQPLLPLHRPDQNVDGYSLYPAFRLDHEKIHEGAGSLAEYILTHKTVVIDGYAGVFWDDLKQALQDCFKERGLEECISDTGNWFYPQEKINTLLAPFLGEKEAVWGTKCDKELSDLFDQEKIRKCLPDPTADINIVMGVGAAFAGWDAPLIYVDLPKNELQYRMRAGSVTNLGCLTTEEPAQMYKRFYFVDWVVLNKHKKALLDRIDIVADDQHPGTLTWMHGEDMTGALQTMSENVFRVRPWFEPGAWGGQWLKKRIEGINPEEVNYAWSFELITPENGLLFESDGLLLEVSFDFLMFAHHREILGQKFAERFGDEFPIRFDFLDTMSGGNLSIQCHPTVPYIKRYFGESFTQDETYYILDADEKAGVYLGFQEDIDAKAFRKELERSNEEHIPVEITRYVQRIAAKKHDLFLIPSGTVHSAAKGNLVLEISATPYIFTFKMYDWLRLDLNGDPRPINIAHAFNNLDFSRKGARVKEELISKPYPLNAGKDWKQIHLPTHPEHFYDVHRYEFRREVRVETGGSPHVLMLVEGTSVLVETKNGLRQRYHYGETFVIPAAAENYRLINKGSGIAKVVTAFLK